MRIFNKNLFLNRLCNFSTSATNLVKKKICIVGAGPAGFYAAQYILKQLADSEVDIIERLPVPFGLVRFGVAPDHPEVKNVINTFTKTAENPRLRYLGNISLGKDVELKELRDKYHAVLLTYGAEKDRELGIQNEHLECVISARNFVAWYNGLPGAENLKPNLDSKIITLIGQGNVAIDAARILLSTVDSLRTTDITEHALEGLSKSKVGKVFLVGRRGPLHAAFTIKELREMLKLPNVDTIWRQEDFNGVRDVIGNLQRPRKRLTELMLKSLDEAKTINSKKKQFLPIFFRSPKIIKNDNSFEFYINEIQNDQAKATNFTEHLPTDLILRSIGYKSICVDPDIHFDEKNGFVINNKGRILQNDSNPNDNIIDKGLYAAGWLATGPTGVIVTTMNGAFAVGKNICDDINSNIIDCTETKPGLDITNMNNVITWSGWAKIDKAEIEAGKKLGKTREKIMTINEMIEIAN